MFEKKKCSECGSKVKEEWKFCPECGSSTGVRMRKMHRMAMPAGVQTVDLSDMFKEIEKEFSSIDKMFSQEKRHIRPVPKNGNVRGISITIQTGTGQQPRVHVQSMGNFKQTEPEIRRRLTAGHGFVEEESDSRQRVVKKTEEPDTEIRSVGNKQIILVKLPDVVDGKDVEIKRLEQSIEIRAFAKNKMYFKLLPVSSSRVNREFKNGVLKLEVS